MFDVLERHAEELGISDYSLSQTSLEQVCHLSQHNLLRSEPIRLYHDPFEIEKCFVVSCTLCGIVVVASML